MEVKNKLLNFNSYIYQNNEWFNFSLDSVLLANFVTINLSDKKILDLATGNAPIPMLLTYRTNALIYGIELQKSIYDLAVKSINTNKMNDNIFIVNDDIKNLCNYFNPEFFDIVVCNPPYFKYSDVSNTNLNSIKAIARHEIMITLDDIIKDGSKYLKNKGKFAIVHRTDRLIEIIDLFKKYKIEPKKIQLVYPLSNSESNIVLIEGIKNGNSGVKFLSPIIVHNDDRTYTSEITKMFGDVNNVAK